MRYVNDTKGDAVGVIVRSDGVDCPELRLSSEGNNAQCWIAVKAGQAISVLIELELNTSQYQIDLVIDGVLRNIWVSTVTPSNESRKALLECFEGVHKYYRSLFRSGMYTSRLDDGKGIVFNDTDHTSVGTIEVLVYKYDEGFGHIRDAKLPEDVVDWEDLTFQPGSSGIKPTHETVLTRGARLTDTERRSWKNKTGKVLMGHAPLVTFKILYRHEQVLRQSDIVDPRLDFLPTAESVSAHAAGLLQMADINDPAAIIPNAPIGIMERSFNGEPATALNLHTTNPYAISERNGWRIYKLITVNPENPGPQITNAGARSKQNSSKKRKRQSKSRRSSTVDLDTDSQASFGQSEEEDSEIDERALTSTTKKRRKDVSALRTEVVKMQAELEKAERLEALEKTKTQQMDMDLEKEHEDLKSQWAALEQKLKHTKTQTESYKKRQGELKRGFEELAVLKATGPRNQGSFANKSSLINTSSRPDNVSALGHQNIADDDVTGKHYNKYSDTAGGFVAAGLDITQDDDLVAASVRRARPISTNSYSMR